MSTCSAARCSSVGVVKVLTASLLPRLMSWRIPGTRLGELPGKWRFFWTLSQVCLVMFAFSLSISHKKQKTQRKKKKKQVAQSASGPETSGCEAGELISRFSWSHPNDARACSQRHDVVAAGRWSRLPTVSVAGRLDACHKAGQLPI